MSDDKAALVGFANHRLNMNATINLSKELTFNITAIYYGARYGYTSADTSGSSVMEKLDPMTLINLFLNYQTPVKGLTIGLGVYDVMNQKYVFLQPYDGGHAPLPGPPREIIFKLKYALNFKKKEN